VDFIFLFNKTGIFQDYRLPIIERVEQITDKLLMKMTRRKNRILKDQNDKI